MTKRITMVLAAGALALLGTITSAPAASAHDSSASIGGCGSRSDKTCGYGGVTNGHQRVYSCDTYGDNAGIRVKYWLKNGDTGFIDDANGSSSGCSGEFRGSTTNTITYFQVCKKLTPLYCIDRVPA